MEWKLFLTSWDFLPQNPTLSAGPAVDSLSEDRGGDSHHQ
jgi:hypothetical protein